MAIDPVQRLLEIQVQERLCHMYSSEFNDVTGWELNPLISLLQTIREEYSFTKPDVYRTVVALLQDYKPICGEKHREKTLRYLKLLLCCKPELGDFLSRVLPPAVTVSAQYSHCLQSALTRGEEQHTVSRDTDENRPGEPVEPSPVLSAAVVISTSGNMATMIAATLGNVPNLPTTGSKAPVCSTLLWPIAAHASTQSMSQKALARAVGLATSQRESAADRPTAQMGEQGMTATQLSAFTLGQGKGRFVAANRTQSISLPVVGVGSAPALQCVVTRAARKPVAVPRCFILRPVCTSVTANAAGLGTVTTCKPSTQTAPGINKSAAENKQHVIIPAVHTTIRQILMPRVIPQATFSMPASTVGCRVTQSKIQAASQVQRPASQASNTLQGLVAIRSAASSQLTADDEMTGKTSPLSCIQTLVANAGAATQWITMDDKIPDFTGTAGSQSESPTSNENDMIIHLSVSADKGHFVSAATDEVDLKQASCFIRKRLSKADDLPPKITRQS